MIATIGDPNKDSASIINVDVPRCKAAVPKLAMVMPPCSHAALSQQHHCPDVLGLTILSFKGLHVIQDGGVQVSWALSF